MNEDTSPFDFFSNKPIKRTIDWNGQQKDFWFKRISGDQRVKLNRGNKVTLSGEKRDPEGKHQMDLDMSSFEAKRHELIHYSVCKGEDDTSPLFRKVEDVARLPESAIALLWREADEINKEVEDPKKS